MNIDIADEPALAEFAEKLVKQIRPPCVVYLQGDLGVGKTTFARKCLRALGYSGAIKSPTYTLIESYETDKCPVHHLDLYRIKDPEELAFLGLQELLHQKAMFLIEWPEQGGELLPPPDVVIQFEFTQLGRALTLLAKTPVGQQLLKT